MTTHLPSKSSPARIFAFASLLALASPLSAQTTYNYTGAGANTVWSTPENWSNNVTPTFGTDAVLVFDYNFGANNILATGGARTVRSLVFGSGLTGGTGFQIRTRDTTTSGTRVLTLNGGAGNASIVIENITDTSLNSIQLGNNIGSIAFATDVDVTNDSASAVLNFANVVSGTGALNLYGIGKIALTRENTFSGGINIYGGTVQTRLSTTSAGTGTITLGGTNSANDATWSAATTVTYANSVVVNGGGGTRTIRLDDGADGNAGNPTLSGGVTLNTNVTFDISQYTANTHDRITVSGAVSGSGGIVKDGTGILVLTAANTYSGGTTISAGTLELGNGGSVAGNITNNATLSINRTDDSTLGNAVSGTGSLLKSGAGTLALSASNSYSGGTTLSAGVLRLGNDSALGTGTLAVTASSTLTSDGATARSIGNAVTLGSGTANVALISGDATGTGALTLSGPVTLGGTTGSRIFTVNNALTTVSGLITSGTSSGAVVKNGTGTLVLANTANTFTNNVSLQNGTLQVTKLSDKGTASSIGTMQGASFLQIGQTTSSAVLNYTGTGDTTDLQVSIGNGAGNGGASIFNNGSGALVFDNPVFNVASGADAGANTRNLALGGTNTGANEIQGVIADITALNKTTQVVKNNTGTWILSGNNTYSGVTAVNAGALIINGDQSAATGAVTVAANATLGGSGTIGGATTISGTHSPGNSADVQTFANGLTYATGSTFVWELFANTADLADRGDFFDGVDVTGGTLTIQSGVTTSLVFNGAGSTVLWSDGFWQSNQSWLVFDNANAPSILGIPTISVGFDSATNDFSTSLVGSSFNWGVQGDDIYLNYVVPEPSTYALLALAAAGLGAHVVRRRRSAR